MGMACFKKTCWCLRIITYITFMYNDLIYIDLMLCNNFYLNVTSRIVVVQRSGCLFFPAGYQSFSALQQFIIWPEMREDEKCRYFFFIDTYIRNLKIQFLVRVHHTITQKNHEWYGVFYSSGKLLCDKSRRSPTWKSRCKMACCAVTKPICVSDDNENFYILLQVYFKPFIHKSTAAKTVKRRFTAGLIVCGLSDVNNLVVPCLRTACISIFVRSFPQYTSLLNKHTTWVEWPKKVKN